MRRLPAAAVLLALAGIVPFAGCALAALGTLDVVQADYWMRALCGYGAVILSFVGGVHWGFVLGAIRPDDSAAPPLRIRYRLVLGVLPALGGWAAILVMFTGYTVVSLAILIGGFIAFASAESELSRRGLVPPGYLVLRWIITAVVVAILGAVLAFRVLGGRLSF